MNQKYIWIVTIVLSISLFGLILTQGHYYQSVADIKQEQFNLTVSKVLNQVAAKLSSDEEKCIVLETKSKPRFTAAKKQTKRKFNFGKNAQYGLSLQKSGGLKKTQGLSDFNRQNYGNVSSKDFEGKIPYITKQIKFSSLPIEERLNLKLLPEIITQKLKDNGINLPFEYAIKSKNKFVVYSKEFFTDPSVEKYSKQLFSEDLFPKMNYLYLAFPEQQSYLTKSYIMLLPSLILTLILILCSAFTIYIIFRQKRLSKIKNDFINNMTHEFKTPISTISLASQMLKDNSVNLSATRVNDISKIINTESRRLSFQVEKVLQMAVFNEDRMKLKPKPIHIHRIIQNLLTNFTLRVEDKKGQIHSNLEATNDLITVDEVHFGNIISNLLDNAIKYSKDKPEININTKNKRGGILISVTDKGIGISNEDQRMVFERFFRVHTGNVHDVKGFGLGLSYVKKVVDAHGATVSVDSVLNKGSKFEIFVPQKK